MEINKPVNAIIFLIVTLILVFLFVVPKYQESSDLQKSLLQKQSEYDSRSVYYLKIFQVLKNIESRKDVLEKIDNALPSNFSFASLLYFLQKNTDKAGLTVRSIEFSQVSPAVYEQIPPSTSQKEVTSIMFTINLSGNYQGLKNFLFSLEKSARLFEVNTISFASLESSQSIAQFQNQLQTHDFRLEVKTHTY